MSYRTKKNKPSYLKQNTYKQSGGRWWKTKKKTDTIPPNVSKKKSKIPSTLTINQTVHNKLTDKETNVQLREMLSWSGDSFSVLDENSHILYNIKGKLFSLRDTMTIYDSTNHKVAVVQQKIFSLRTIFQIFKYKPVCPEQPSTEKDRDNIPLYPFACITKYIFSMLQKYVYKLYNGKNKQGKTIMTINRQLSIKKNYIIKNSNQNIVGKIRQTSFFQIKEANIYALTVAPNNDLLGCIILAVIADTVSDKKK